MAIAFVFACFASPKGAPLAAQQIALVPKPLNATADSGESFSIPNRIAVFAPNDELWQAHLGVFNDALQQLTAGQHELIFAGSQQATLLVSLDQTLASESYRIVIAKDKVKLVAGGLKGLTHATATLLQLVGQNPSGVLQPTTIEDSTKLSYRNLMIDMGRNPHSIQLLKETIDLLWYYKVDSIQLHLTDDQRFAFPSTAFPKLWDGKITLDEFEELERYAVVRGVTIVPELEVPGHSGKLRSLYPETFGKSATDLASSPKALAGIKTLIDEMNQVFESSPYFHIGGDEAFGVPEELQRDLINELHGYLKSKGKQTVVWEGPRPGKGKNRVNQEVIHINWRTINYGADQMVKDGYRVVNAAWDPLYIVDHYPRTNFTMTSPRHIYETLQLTRFKHVNPGIRTYSKPINVNASDQLIGFCMPWWEGREENFFPQVVARLIPMAEVAWDPTVTRDYDDFAKRVSLAETTRLRAFYPIEIQASNLLIEQDGVYDSEAQVELKTRLLEGVVGEVRYTLDGSEPNHDSTLYSKPFQISKSVQVRATVFVDGQQIGHGSRRNLTAVIPVQNLALGKPVQTSVSSASPFSVERVTDGGISNLEFYLGYPAVPKPINITIDLGDVKQVSRIVVYAYTVSGSFEKYSVEVSRDGKEFEEVATRMERPEKSVPFVEHQFDPRQARYVRIVSHGNKGYVFDSFSKVVEVQVFE